jgi:hypothetical protein
MYNDTEVIVIASSDDSDIRMMIVMVASPDVNLHRDRSLGLFVFDGKGGFGGC